MPCPAFCCQTVWAEVTGAELAPSAPGKAGLTAVGLCDFSTCPYVCDCGYGRLHQTKTLALHRPQSNLAASQVVSGSGTSPSLHHAPPSLSPPPATVRPHQSTSAKTWSGLNWLCEWNGTLIPSMADKNCTEAVNIMQPFHQVTRSAVILEAHKQVVQSSSKSSHPLLVSPKMINCRPMPALMACSCHQCASYLTHSAML